jgi:hypothetical protein
VRASTYLLDREAARHKLAIIIHTADSTAPRNGARTEGDLLDHDGGVGCCSLLSENSRWGDYQIPRSERLRAGEGRGGLQKLRWQFIPVAGVGGALYL